MVLNGRTGIINTNKRIVLNKLSILLKYFNDPLHCGHKRNRYIDDDDDDDDDDDAAVLYVLQGVYSNL